MSKTHFKIVLQEATESDNQEWSVSACGRDEFELGTEIYDQVTCKACIAKINKESKAMLKGEK